MESFEANDSENDDDDKDDYEKEKDDYEDDVNEDNDVICSDYIIRTHIFDSWPHVIVFYANSQKS